MPSPLAHALGGIAAGWLVAPAASGHATRVRLAAFAAAGAAADLDLLAGGHRGPTHGLGAAVLVGIVVWASGTRAGGSAAVAGRFALAVGLAYASHTLLDWLGRDTSPPIGL